jgi:hypothetical protein
MFLASAQLLISVCGIAKAQPISRRDMLAYLVQSICIDTAGRTLPLLPIDKACTRKRLQKVDDRAVYRKYDWGARNDPRHAVTGYQASDSVIERRGGRLIIVQTADFGNAGRVFGHFDEGMGDAADALVLIDGWASLAMTEDVTQGIQWFSGEICKSQPSKAFLGWLMFKNDALTPGWKQTVTHLALVRGPGACPQNFSKAYMRYRAATIKLPFRIVGDEDRVRQVDRMTPVIISEHYGIAPGAKGDGPSSADGLERFYFARDLGKVRWERWVNLRLAKEPNIPEESAALAASGRCPSIAYSGAPGPQWRMVDCHNWTTLKRQRGKWSVDRYNWWALASFGPRQPVGIPLTNKR